MKKGKKKKKKKTDFFFPQSNTDAIVEIGSLLLDQIPTLFREIRMFRCYL
jgi:hypothetical protein